MFKKNNQQRGNKTLQMLLVAEFSELSGIIFCKGARVIRFAFYYFMFYYTYIFRCYIWLYSFMTLV